MASNGWDVVLLNASDPHCSEYPSARWKQAEWLTGFTGEAASVAVTPSHAGLWTDTRYFIQSTTVALGAPGDRCLVTIFVHSTDLNRIPDGSNE